MRSRAVSSSRTCPGGRHRVPHRRWRAGRSRRSARGAVSGVALNHRRWETEGEPGADAQVALDLKGAAVQLQSLPHQGQSQSEALRRAGVDVTSAEETLAQMHELVGWD